MIEIARYQFDGPYYEVLTNFNEVAAVYVILDANNKVIDVGETEALKTRLVSHERRNCWERNCGRGIYVAVFREDRKERRLEIEKQIRAGYNFPCGEN